VGVASGGAASGRAEFHAVDEVEMVQPLDNVQVSWDRMRVELRHVFETSLFGGPVRSVRREVRLVFVEV
jgi:hypothetical protein